MYLKAELQKWHTAYSLRRCFRFVTYVRFAAYFQTRFFLFEHVESFLYFRRARIYLFRIYFIYINKFVLSLKTFLGVGTFVIKCGVRACAGASGCVVRLRRSLGASLKLSMGFPDGSSPCLRLHVPGPRSVISWTFLSRARPSLRHAPRLLLLLSILQRCFRSTAGGSNPLSSLSLVPTTEVYPQSVPVQSRLSVCLSDRP